MPESFCLMDRINNSVIDMFPLLPYMSFIKV